MHALLRQLLLDLRVIAKIDLGTDDKAGHSGAMVVDFGEPFLADVLEGGGGGNAKTDKEDIGLGIRERTEAVVIFLTCGIKEAKGIRFVADPEDAMLWLADMLTVAAQNDVLHRDRVKYHGRYIT